MASSKHPRVRSLQSEKVTLTMLWQDIRNVQVKVVVGVLSLVAAMLSIAFSMGLTWCSGALDAEQQERVLLEAQAAAARSEASQLRLDCAAWEQKALKATEAVGQGASKSRELGQLVTTLRNELKEVQQHAPPGAFRLTPIKLASVGGDRLVRIVAIYANDMLVAFLPGTSSVPINGINERTAHMRKSLLIRRQQPWEKLELRLSGFSAAGELGRQTAFFVQHKDSFLAAYSVSADGQVIDSERKIVSGAQEVQLGEGESALRFVFELAFIQT